MFVGFDYDKIEVADDVDGKHFEQQYYTAVMQPGSKYSFIVVILDTLIKRNESVNSIFADSVPCLLAIMDSSEITVIAVYLVTPAHMNLTGDLDLERLSKISIGYEPEDMKQEAYILEVLRRKDYVDSTLGTPAIYLCNVTTLCSFKMPQDR